METKYKKLRLELDELGYKQKFDQHSAPLVEKLFLDLKTTTDSLRKYMELAQNAIEERDSLQLAAEPYQCDNAKLVKECNVLHLKLLKFKEENKKNRHELKKQSHLTEQIKQREEKLLKRIRQLEIELVNSRSGKSRKSGSFEIDSAMALADQKIANLTKEVKNLNEQILQLMGVIDTCEAQLKLRDEEIDRLQKMLEGGRPLNAVKKECCYRDIGGKIQSLQQDLESRIKEKNAMENRMKDALNKQHEAMQRALYLAEKNRQLEQQISEVDAMALTVEADCNNKIKEQVEIIQRLQSRLQEVVTQLQDLEKENENIKGEKRKLQNVLETTLDEKKRLADKLNNFTKIEHDLNVEIDRLMKQVAQQKRQIAELEGQSGKDFPEETTRKIPRKANIDGKNKATQQKDSVSELSVKSVIGHDKTCRCVCDSSKHFKELLDKEMEYRQSQSNRCLETLTTEKDYFMKEYHRVLEQLRTIPTKTDNLSELMQKINDKNVEIQNLQREMKTLSQENHELMLKLESTRREDPDSGGKCMKPNCRKIERERDLIRNDLEHLQEERDSLKLKTQNLTEENEKLKKQIVELEGDIRRLKKETNDLKYDQGSRRSALDDVEQQCSCLKEQLRDVQNEFSRQKNSYNQLKTLHEQSDRNLQDTKNKLSQCQAELGNALDELKRREYSREDVDKEISALKNDVQVMRGQLTKMDQEKDELLAALDQKTERLAKLTHELEVKDKSIDSLEELLCDLKKKLSIVIDENNNNQQLLRANHAEVENLRRELEAVQRLKDSTMLENRRLQDDLSAATVDCRAARNDLEISKRQVEDLKRQLQHYVAEVKRAEDLISQKEVERNEILDQYKSLTEEANLLENNNVTLENQASQSKVQLSVALDHAGELERKLQDQDSIIRSYERQIAEMTSQIASLEIQLKQNGAQLQRTESELNHMRELCLKLDSDNSKIKKQIQQTREAESRIQLHEIRVETTPDSDRENFSRLQEEFERMQAKVRELEEKFSNCICCVQRKSPEKMENVNRNSDGRRTSSIIAVKSSETDVTYRDSLQKNRSKLTDSDRIRYEGNFFDFTLKDDKGTQCEFKGNSFHLHLQHRPKE